MKWDNGACAWAEEIRVIRMSIHSLTGRLCIAFEMSHENRILVSPWCMEVQQDLKWEHSNHIKAEKLGHCQPKSFLRITTCFKCKKKTVAVWETQRTKGPYHIPSRYLPVTCLYSSTTQAETDDTERNGKIRQSVALLPLSLSPHSSAGQRLAA